MVDAHRCWSLRKEKNIACRHDIHGENGIVRETAPVTFKDLCTFAFLDDLPECWNVQETYMSMHTKKLHQLSNS